jgi:hypothetical protein
MYRRVRKAGNTFQFFLRLQKLDLRPNEWDLGGSTDQRRRLGTKTDVVCVARAAEPFKKYVRAVIYVRQPYASEIYWWD